MEGIEVRAEDNGKDVVLKCKGFIDSTTAGEIEKAITDTIGKKKYRIIVDMAETEYVSSAGWGIFVGFIKELRKNRGDIKFANMGDEVREIYELLDFTNILEYYGDIESAKRAF